MPIKNIICICQIDSELDRQIDSELDIQIDSELDRQIDKELDRQIDNHPQPMYQIRIDRHIDRKRGKSIPKITKQKQKHTE